MDASQAPKAVRRSARTTKIGHFDPLRVADHDILDLALSIEQNADLTTGLE